METNLKNIEVLCSLRIEWLGAVKSGAQTKVDKQKYAQCEIIEPKFISSNEFHDFEGKTSMKSGLPISFNKCQKMKHM